MADVQLENGYTRIANELLEALAMYDFSGQERKFLDAIIRLSYGCGKKTATFPSWSMCECFGLPRQHLLSNKKREGILEKLVKAEVVLVDYETKTLGLQKYYKRWKIRLKRNVSAPKFKKLIEYNLKCNLQVTNVTPWLQNDCNLQVTGLSPTGYNDVTYRLQDQPLDPHDDKPEMGRKERKEIKDNNDHDLFSPQNEDEKKEILIGATASDHTILLGAIMRKWGSQIIHQPPLAQITAALQEHARETLLEAIGRAPLVLKEPDRMKLVGFIIAVAEHPIWYLDKADVIEIQTEDARERAKEKRLIWKCEESLRSALRDGAESEIYGYIRFLARHRDEEELTTFGVYCPSLTKTLDYYQSVWKDPGDVAYE